MPHSFLEQVTWKRNESETSVVCTGLGKCTFELATRGKCFSWRGSLSQGKTTTFHSPNGSRCIRCPSPAVEWFKISVKDYLPVLGYFFFLILLNHFQRLFEPFWCWLGTIWCSNQWRSPELDSNYPSRILCWFLATFFLYCWTIFNVFLSHSGAGWVQSGAQTNPMVNQWMVITKSGFKLSIKDRLLVLGYLFLILLNHFQRLFEPLWCWLGTIWCSNQSHGQPMNGDHQIWIQTIHQGSFAGSWLLFFSHCWTIFNVVFSHFGAGWVLLRFWGTRRIL